MVVDCIYVGISNAKQEQKQHVLCCCAGAEARTGRALELWGEPPKIDLAGDNSLLERGQRPETALEERQLTVVKEKDTRNM